MQSLIREFNLSFSLMNLTINFLLSGTKNLEKVEIEDYIIIMISSLLLSLNEVILYIIKYLLKFQQNVRIFKEYIKKLEIL